MCFLNSMGRAPPKLLNVRGCRWFYFSFHLPSGGLRVAVFFDPPPLFNSVVKHVGALYGETSPESYSKTPSGIAPASS